nr:hypothetical protein [Chryseobacterium manosquense]
MILLIWRLFLMFALELYNGGGMRVFFHLREFEVKSTTSKARSMNTWKEKKELTKIRSNVNGEYQKSKPQE